jgi:hypothetical protein
MKKPDTTTKSKEASTMDSSFTTKQQQGSNGCNTMTTTNKKKNATTTTTLYQSKRQRRAAGPNPSNTWQQQPKIKSAGARARAYIKYAGLANEQNYSINNNNKNTSTTTTTATTAHLLDPQLELDSPEIKFGRLLGGTDQRTRHGAVQMLRAYLSSRSDFSIGGLGLSELDLLKLWKVSQSTMMIMYEM